MFSRRSDVLSTVATLTVGAVFGLLAQLLATVGGSVGHVADLVLAAGWAWAALAFCVGLVRKSWLGAAILAAVALFAAVIAYYLTRLMQGRFLKADLRDPTGRTVEVDWSGLLSNTVVWCIAAGLLGALVGLAGSMARDRGLRGLPFRLLVPLVAIVDTSLRLHFDGPLQGPTATITWSAIRLAAVVVILVLTGHTVMIARSSSRPSVETDKNQA